MAGCSNIPKVSRRIGFHSLDCRTDHKGTERLFSIFFFSLQLTIYIRDVNNHVPQFKEKSRNAAVAETAGITQPVATIIATDEDRGVNGEIVFSLETANYTSSAKGIFFCLN